MLITVQEIRFVHAVRKISDICLHPDELRRNVIRNAVDGDAGVIVYLAGDAVGEALIEPFL